jgi:transcription initiation factor IIE alpha subunit
MDNSNANVLVERLVKTIARAFYNDTVIAVLDNLLREKFIREEEISPRLKLPAKDVRRVIQQLESEMLVKFEDMVMEDNRNSRCYYIDYQLFVNVVRYRVHLMRRGLDMAQKNELNVVYYECPTCKRNYSSLEAQRLMSADFKFICSDCCPYENFRTAVSEPSFRLVEVDRGSKLTDVQLYSRKLESQLRASPDHEGIFEILAALRDKQLIHNLPSDNRGRGLTASKIQDADVAQELAEGYMGQRVPVAKRKNAGPSTQIIMGHEVVDGGFTVTVDDNSPANKKSRDVVSDISDPTGRIQPAPVSAKAAQFPEFLMNSRVLGAEDIVRKNMSHLLTEGSKADEVNGVVKVEEQKNGADVVVTVAEASPQSKGTTQSDKNIKSEQEAVVVVTATEDIAVKGEGEGDEDDVDWED